ncbi:MAG: hypothetical protein JKX70_10290 [Phycisphaerales bacterium]|nr:hypothetical protein [Phycisphaerales bacterium]
MNTITLTALAAITASSALADVASFTETFESGTNNWLMGSFVDPIFNATGALDGSAYISSSADLNSAGPFGLSVFRGEDNFDASGDAFVGDYLAGGINRLTFDFRHDADIDLGVALRIAGPNNFPGMGIELPGFVAGGEWITLSFDLDFNNPLLTLEGAPTIEFFNDVMTAVGNIQVSIDRPDGLTTPLIVNFDLDNVSITPAPSALALLTLGGLMTTRRRR